MLGSLLSRLVAHRRTRGQRARCLLPLRYLLAAVSGTAVALACGATIASATFVTNCAKTPSGYSDSDPNMDSFWYAATETNTDSGPPVPIWSIDTGSGTSTQFITEGAKGNISTGGTQAVFESFTHQHVLNWISSLENSTAAGGRWIQVGTQLGYSSTNSTAPCTPTNQFTLDQPSPPPAVYVEIYDDSGSGTACFLSFFGNAPSNASYDARYYAQVGSLYRYKAFFQAPGGSIQVLAYGDFAQPYTAELAGAEIHTDACSSCIQQIPPCPNLGANNTWNQFGAPASPATFADQLELYNGSWEPWNSSATGKNGATVQTQVYVTDPSTYQIQLNSNFTTFQTGGY